MNVKNKVEVDFINENININDYLADLPSITELDLTGNLEYKQTEFKPTLYRYIRLMNKENRDENGNLIVPSFSYDCNNFSPTSYSYPYKKGEKGKAIETEREKIRRLQKTKLSTDSYPFSNLIPTNEKKEISDEKTEKNIDKNILNSKIEGRDKNVSNFSQENHYNVQNFSIIILCLLVNAFCCIIYYTNDWPDVINRLPNQIELSKIIINDSFIFTGSKLYTQKNNNLNNIDYHIALKNMHYGDISLDESDTNSRVKCTTAISNGNSIVIGHINFTLIDDKNITEISTSGDYNIISFNMDIDNVNQLDLSQATSIFGEDNFIYHSESYQSLELKKENPKKTLLEHSDKLLLHLYDTKNDEIFYHKLFEVKNNVVYAAIFENNTFSLMQANQRPKINSNDREKTNKIFIDWSIPLGEKVEAADIVINNNMIYKNGKEIKFIYIANNEFHIGKLFFNGTKFSKVMDMCLPKINLSYIYGNNIEDYSKIKLLVDSKGFPTITFNENTIINCNHPLCIFDQFP